MRSSEGHASIAPWPALAATLAAGLDGIDRELPGPEAIEADLYQRHAAGETLPPRLPRDLHDALAALRADAILCDDVGPAFCEQFLTLKRVEWDAYAQQVSDWELERYASAS